MLAKTYEALGMWRDAAIEYESVVRNPYQDTLFKGSIIGPEWFLDQLRLARIYDRLNDTDRARQWYERFTEDWKDADSDIPELIEARERLAELRADE